MRFLALSFVCFGFLIGCGGGSTATQNPSVIERPADSMPAGESPTSDDAV